MEGCWQRVSSASGLRAPALSVRVWGGRLGGFLLSPLRLSAIFRRCQNCTAPGEMLNMEGSNFWPRKGEPSVSQPFFSISCTFCKEATGSRQARVQPTPLPVPLTLPATLDEGTGSSHRCQGCMPTRRIEESCGAQQQHPAALGDSSSDVQGRTTTSMLHPPSSPLPRKGQMAHGDGKERRATKSSSLVGLNPDPCGFIPEWRQRGDGRAGSGGRDTDVGPNSSAGGSGLTGIWQGAGKGKTVQAKDRDWQNLTPPKWICRGNAV